MYISPFPGDHSLNCTTRCHKLCWSREVLEKFHLITRIGGWKDDFGWTWSKYRKLKGPWECNEWGRDVYMHIDRVGSGWGGAQSDFSKAVLTPVCMYASVPPYVCTCHIYIYWNTYSKRPESRHCCLPKHQWSFHPIWQEVCIIKKGYHVVRNRLKHRSISCLSLTER